MHEIKRSILKKLWLRLNREGAAVRDLMPNPFAFAQNQFYINQNTDTVWPLKEIR